MKRLVVTADDFGVAVEVNEAVETAHRDGILTAASLMVAGSAAADAVRRAVRLRSLRVGLHLVLVDGRPALPPEAIPDLVEPGGRLRGDLVAAGIALFLRRRVRDQLAREIAAQFAAFRRTGLDLDHVNAHRHFHLHPTVFPLLLAVGRRYGMRALRVPAEPRAALRRAAPDAPCPRTFDTALWTALLRRRCRAAGLLAPDRVFGLAWSGAMTAARLAALLRDLPDGLSEVYLHPAVAGGFDGADPRYRYADELAALLSPAVAEAARESGCRLGGFGDFAAVAR